MTNGSATPRRGMALASLILGILSIPTLGLALVGAVAGIVLGVAAMVKQSRNPREYGGKGMALTGVVLCGVSFLLIPFIGIIAAIAIPSLLRARVSANEAAAINQVREVVRAESGYAEQNAGFYDTLECLARPATCRAGATAVPLAPVSPRRSGYVFTFHPGPPAPVEALAGGTPSRSSLTAFAFSALPETRGRTGVRAFCGDATGRICAAIDGSPPAIVAGQCVMATDTGDVLPRCTDPGSVATAEPPEAGGDEGADEGADAATDTPAAVRVGGNIREPRKIKNVGPVYPDIARQARVEGIVILEVTISPQGKVTQVKVLRGIPLLDAAAIEAVRQWEYTPTLLSGVPVPVIMTVTVNFRLS